MNNNSLNYATAFEISLFCFVLGHNNVNVVFLDGDNFCKAFAGAQVHLSYHEWRSFAKIVPIPKNYISTICVSSFMLNSSKNLRCYLIPTHESLNRAGWQINFKIIKKTFTYFFLYKAYVTCFSIRVNWCCN